MKPIDLTIWRINMSVARIHYGVMARNRLFCIRDGLSYFPPHFYSQIYPSCNISPQPDFKTKYIKPDGSHYRLLFRQT